MTPKLSKDLLYNSRIIDTYIKLAKKRHPGVDTAAVLSQSLITPSCGAGSLTLDLAEKVLTFTRDVSEKIRKEVDLW